MVRARDLSDEQLNNLLGTKSSNPNNLEDIPTEQLESILNTSAYVAPSNLEREMETVEQDSFFKSAASKAGAFTAGFEAIPAQIVKNVRTSLADLGEFAGIISPIDEELIKIGAENKLRQSKEAIGERLGRAEDVKKNPLTEAITRRGGALIGELIAGGSVLKATKGASTLGNIFRGIGQDALVGGLVGGLEADDNVVGATTASGAFSGVLGGIFRGGQALLTKALHGSPASNFGEAVARAEQIRKQTGVPVSPRAVAGGTGGQQQAVQEAGERVAQQFGTNLARAAQSTKAKDAGIAVNMFNKAVKSVEDSTGGLYKKWLSQADKGGAFDLSRTKEVMNQYGKAVSSIDDIAALNLSASKTYKPSEILELRKAVDAAIQPLKRNLSPTTQDINLLRAATKLRNGLEADLSIAAQKTGTDGLYNAAKESFLKKVLPLRELGVDVNKKGVVEFNKISRLLKDPTTGKRQLAKEVLSQMPEKFTTQIKIKGMNEAIQKSLNNEGLIDASKLAKNLSKNFDDLGIILNKKDKIALEGFKKLRGVVGSPGSGNLSRLDRALDAIATSEFAQPLLIKAGQLPPNHPRLRAIANTLIEAASAARTGAATIPGTEIGRRLDGTR